MPRFFFSVDDIGHAGGDEDADDLPNMKAARHYAVESAREILSAGASEGWDRTGWSMTVRDAAGTTLFVLPFYKTMQKQSAESLSPLSK